MDEKKDVLECAICLQVCVYPTELPCGHIFCFLCIKGLTNHIKKCAMCRQDIPHDFLENPKLVQPEKECSVIQNVEYQWFYEGRNGWWKYDIRTNRELDEAFQSGVKNCELLIAGYLYIINFDLMLQIRKSDSTRRRKIKRNVIELPIKGIAGIKCPETQCRSKTPEISNDNDNETVLNDELRVQNNNTADESSDSLENTINQLSSLNLNES